MIFGTGLTYCRNQVSVPSLDGGLEEGLARTTPIAKSRLVVAAMAETLG